MEFQSFQKLIQPEYSYCPKCGGVLRKQTVKPHEPERLVCQSCRFIFFLDPKVAVGAIISHRGQILLGRRGIEPAYGKWVFPGGFVDRGERLEEAAIRETREESQVDIRILRLLGVYSYTHYPVIIIVYVAEVVGGVAEAGDETLEVNYFEPSAIPWEELAFSSTAQALRDFLGGKK